MDVDEDGAHCITSPRRRCKVEASPSHRDMYKRTPKSWKNKFRQGCIQRLHQNRHKLVEQLRGACSGMGSSQEAKGKEFIDDLMKEELKEIKKLEMDPHILCDCCSDVYSRSNDDGIDSIVKLMDEIRDELIKEEKLILQEYNELQNFDQNNINAALGRLDAEYVICPVCKRNQLFQNKQVFFCSCGIRIDTGYDGITLAQVHKQIEDSVQQHGLLCIQEPVFSVLGVEELDLHNLTLRCQIWDIRNNLNCSNQFGISLVNYM